MTTEIKLSSTPPYVWKGYVGLSTLESALVARYLPRHAPIRKLLQVTAARAAAKAKYLNGLPGAQ
jgi:hypothetical protein